MRRLLILSISMLTLLGTGFALLSLSRGLYAESDEYRRLTLSHLHTLGQALQVYAEDHHGRLPRMTTPETVRSVLAGVYLYNASNLSDAAARPFLPNPALSGKRVRGDGAAAAWTVVFYEDHEDGWGRRWVLMLDGHVRHLTRENWLRCRKASGIR